MSEYKKSTYKKLIKEYKELIVICILSVFIGIVVGLIDALFGHGLLFFDKLRESHPLYFIPMLPLLGVFIVISYNKWGKDIKKGMTLIFEVAYGELEKIPLKLIPFEIISTWLSHLFGGSVGRTGVAAQMGATMANFISYRLGFRKNKYLFLIVGISAGFSGLFGTPIAAIFFSLEILISGAIQYEAILPSMIAAIFANIVSEFFGIRKFTFKLPFIELDYLILCKLLIMGIIFGIVGSIFSMSLHKTKENIFKKFTSNVRGIFVISIFLSIFLMFFYEGRYSGSGINIIKDSLIGKGYYYDFILKIILTVITLGIGFHGGEITPMCAIGTSLGALLAGLFNFPIDLGAACGFVAVFGSATNTIFAPIFMGAEVFGFSNLPYFVFVCIIAYVFNLNISIYYLQRESKLYLKKELF